MLTKEQMEEVIRGVTRDNPFHHNPRMAEWLACERLRKSLDMAEAILGILPARTVLEAVCVIGMALGKAEAEVEMLEKLEKEVS